MVERPRPHHAKAPAQEGLQAEELRCHLAGCVRRHRAQLRPLVEGCGATCGPVDLGRAHEHNDRRLLQAGGSFKDVQGAHGIDVERLGRLAPRLAHMCERCQVVNDFR